MISNGMCYVFSFLDPHNQEKFWDVFFNKYMFPVDYIKLYVKGLKQGYKADECMFWNLKWSGAYLSSTLSYALLQKVLKLVLLTETGP